VKPSRGFLSAPAIKTTINVDGGEEMESRHEHATLVPAEHVNTGLSQIGVVVYDDSIFRDALLARCAAGLVATGYRLGGVVQSNWQVSPWRPGAQHPEDAVEDTAVGHPWHAARLVRQHRHDGGPLIIG
jgi:hypothetical protein